MNNSSLGFAKHADYEWAVSLNRYCLKITGLWPQVNHGVGSLLAKLHIIVILIAFTLVCTIPCFCGLIMKCDNIMARINCLGFCIPFLIVYLKYFVLYSKRRILLPVIRMIAEDWAKSKTDAEKGVMIRQGRISRAFIIFSYASTALAVLCIIIMPQFGNSFRLSTEESDLFPIPTYFVYDVSQSPYYEIIFVVQVITIVTSTCCYIGVGHFFGLLILHICGQLEILRTRLSDMKNSDNFDYNLMTVVLNHNQLIRAVDAIEDTYTLLLFVLFLYFGVFICIYGLILVNMITGEGTFSPLELFFSLSTLTNTFVQTALYCTVGQILASQSEGVFDAAYECEWLNLKVKEVKNLILIMTIARRPLYVTAGKIFPLTMLTFCNILKVSFSYISYLLTRI
ncbi:odorant receptor Or2-like [Hylaeus volcanicus]|uniref:odorant receptor Or2-like n=1 Tax=Hylaeus volcanicus TaxID=313075 RepID=UPI0023B77EEE|nr:odorant receptor Or2-like [Hylaeus volcanicus]